MIMTAALLAAAAVAQINISKTEKATPGEEVFMDMAVTAAETAVGQGKPACGAVVILNGAWRAAGMADAGKTAEENAIAKSRLRSLQTASIYTVNQPTTQALNAIMKAGAAAVYFVNSAADVIEAGICTAADYDESKLDPSLTPVPLHQLDYAPARKLVGK